MTTSKPATARRYAPGSDHYGPLPVRERPRIEREARTVRVYLHHGGYREISLDRLRDRDELLAELWVLSTHPGATVPVIRNLIAACSEARGWGMHAPKAGRR
jgi:hypothetical protein